MAFIRTYSSRYQGQIMGDPFLGRLFKKVKKWQPGKTLARIAAPVASLLPIPGAGLLGGALGRLTSRTPGPSEFAPPVLSLFGRIAQRWNVPIETVANIAGAYGFTDQGDPGGNKPRKRQGAKRSAQKKASGGGRRRSAARRPSGSKQSVDWGKIAESAAGALPVAGELAKDIFAEMRKAGVAPGIGVMPPDVSGMVPGFPGMAPATRRGGGALRLPGMGRRRRSVNPANVKALRRSMRRVEGFQKLVKGVNRMFPKIARGAASSSSGRARGHKAGCRCAVCSR